MKEDHDDLQRAAGARLIAKHTNEELEAFDNSLPHEKRAIYDNLGFVKFVMFYGKDRIPEGRGSIRGEFADEDKPAMGMKYPDGNPKTQFGIAKPGDWYTPPIPYYEYSMAHLQGALKYGHFNWRDDPVTMSTYIEAAKRHVDLFKAGQENASDTGIHHLAHAMCCFSIIIDAMAHGTMTDDRFKYRQPHERIDTGMVFEKYIDDAQARVKAIREKWTGFAEKQKQKQKETPLPSFFQLEMKKYPSNANGRRGHMGSRWGVVHGNIREDKQFYWLIVFDGDADITRVKVEDFTINH